MMMLKCTDHIFGFPEEKKKLKLSKIHFLTNNEYYS